MQPSNRFAFKEWAAVCAALESGRQSVILRKGGINEGRDGFRVEHREFWLFPTRFHQQPDELVPEARELLTRASSGAPPADTVRLSSYAVVEDVIRVTDESRLPAIRARHILSDEAIAQRFHYRAPGLHALVLRIYRAPRAIDLPESPHFAGCRSWVDLPAELPTDDLVPVLSDEEFARQRAAIHFALVDANA